MAQFIDHLRSGVTIKGVLTVKPQTNAQVPLTVQGLTSQTANLFEVKNVAGTTLFSVDNNGNVTYVGDETISDALTVAGAIVGNSTLTIAGLTTLSAALIVGTTLTVTGATTLNNALTVAGAISGQSLSITGAVVGNDGATFGGTLTAQSIVSGGTTTSYGQVLGQAGSVSLPAYSFLGDPDTGFYNTANTLYVALGGALSHQFSSGIFLCNAFRSLSANQPIAVQGSATNGATAIGVKIGNSLALTTAGAKIASFYSDNSSTEKAAIGLGGEVLAGAGTALLPSLSFLGDPNTGIWNSAADNIGFTTAGTTKMTLNTNLIIGDTAAGSTAAGVLALSNSATAPTNSANLAQLYSVDISAGNATLGLFTETAVATDVGLASTHSLTVFINGSKYKIELVSVV